jgi:cell shape-determining protein MreC
MEKIEELTLYMIDLNKKIEQLQKENAKLKSSLTTINHK